MNTLLSFPKTVINFKSWLQQQAFITHGLVLFNHSSFLFICKNLDSCSKCVSCIKSLGDYVSTQLIFLNIYYFCNMQDYIYINYKHSLIYENLVEIEIYVICIKRSCWTWMNVLLAHIFINFIFNFLGRN
jgi:hypothetical protein